MRAEHRHGKKDVGGATLRDARETLGCDADDRAYDVVDLNGLADHVAAAELGLPERVAQHRDTGAGWRRVFGRDEVATERRAGVEEVEVARCDGGDRALARRGS